jgi:hypothetical protein
MLGRALAAMLLVTSCATDDPAPVDPGPSLFERAWSETIRPGDAIIAVPGTGSFTTLGALIEQRIDPAHPDLPPDIESRDLLQNVEPIEGAIASAQRAGISDADLEAGAIRFGLWGAGFTKLTAFHYHSLSGLHLTVESVGGTSACANGGIPENIVNYNAGNAEKDARDLYRKAQVWLGAAPGTDRHVILAAHSWGGVVAEYFVANLATLQHDHGVLPDATVAFMVAGGVPGFIPDFRPFGPGFRTVESISGDLTTAVRTYEIDRPDDPVHTFDPRENGGGHHYIIMNGDTYLGWYGITTDELACKGVPGICPQR